MVHRTMAALEAGLDEVRHSPANLGRVELIVRRPMENEREVLDEGRLDLVEGLRGDTWKLRGSSRTPDGAPHPDMQLNLINARLSALVAIDPARRPLAGDQLHLDLDLSEANLPPGSRLEIGSAVIEITDQPHRGCAKFAARFGRDALRLVNSPIGRELRLRGANARVVVPGVVRPGDTVRKCEAQGAPGGSGTAGAASLLYHRSARDGVDAGCGRIAPGDGRRNRQGGAVEAGTRKIVGWVIALAGAVVAVIGALADQLGLGGEGTDQFGGKQVAALIVGIVIMLGGLALVLWSGDTGSSSVGADDESSDTPVGSSSEAAGESPGS